MIPINEGPKASLEVRWDEYLGMVDHGMIQRISISVNDQNTDTKSGTYDLVTRTTGTTN